MPRLPLGLRRARVARRLPAVLAALTALLVVLPIDMASTAPGALPALVLAATEEAEPANDDTVVGDTTTEDSTVEDTTVDDPTIDDPTTDDTTIDDTDTDTDTDVDVDEEPENTEEQSEEPATTDDEEPTDADDPADQTEDNGKDTENEPTPQPKEARTLAGFKPGNIISDKVFFDRTTMTAAQIDSFLRGKVSKCQSGYVCLKDFKQTTVNRPADSYCTGYKGASNESAATILYKVSQACGINPRVLIVMLQKEQGLVTHTWPSQWRYDAALGQGCPDDAPCDPSFVGFFHQIYGAARQMKIYAEGKHFTWYAPGKTWQIQYHPNKSCGTAPVYIENKATAGLYYYTPYQPNAAAMRAGYGEGDACSSYGNRNFYNYFTDWFGSTQTPAPPTNPTATQGLVIVGKDVWLLSGKSRYHITPEAYPEYKAVLGSPRSVSASLLNGYTQGPRGELFVRNPKTGVVALLQNGETHRFSSCGLVSQWGGACGASLVQLEDPLFKKFKVGSEMTTFGRTEAGGRIHRISGSKLEPLYDAAVARHFNSGATPYAAVFPAAGKRLYTVEKRIRFLPGTFIRVTGTSEVWLPSANGNLYHLPSWPHAAEIGLPSKVEKVVAASAISGYRKAEKLGHFLSCDGKTYVAASGKLSTFSGSAPSGFTRASLDADTCRTLSRTGVAISGTAAFLKFSDASRVYHLTAGVFREVKSTAQREAINKGKKTTVLTVNAALRPRVTIGAAYPASRSLVRVEGKPEVWMVDGGSLWHLPNWPMAAEYGLASSSTVGPASVIAGMPKNGALAPFATCDGGTYIASAGRLRAVDPARLGGNKVSKLTADSCGRVTTGTASGPVFVSDGKRTSVAVGGGFLRLPDTASVDRASAGKPRTIHAVAAAHLDRLPAAKVPGEGALVRASNETTVTLISGNVRVRLPNWGVGADLGVQPRYEVVSPEALATRGITKSYELSIFVTCGTQNYIASQGTLRPVTKAALGGFTPVTLTPAACSTLKLSSAKAITEVRLSAPDGKRYALVGGKLVERSAGAGVTVLPVDARTIAGLPRS